MSTTDTSASSSTSAFVTSLIFNGIVAGVFVILFIKLRPREKRVYEPRVNDPQMDIKTLKTSEKVEEPIPKGYFEWVPFLISKPHSFLIQHCSIDGYFFLRYLSIFGAVSLLGCFILFPILLPVNATNGYNLKGFELLGMSNVVNHKRFYAHVFLSWAYFGMIIYIVYRELYYYVTMKHAIETTPYFKSLVSSRTVIITEVDMIKIDKDILYNKFDNIEKIVFGKNFEDLDKCCDEREKYANKLEKLLNNLVTKCVTKRNKWEKKNQFPEKLNGKPENDFQSYTGKRPTQTLGKSPITIPLVSGKQVDTIEYYFHNLEKLNKKISKYQQNWETNFDSVGAVFITFKDQYNAQKCFQSIDYIFGESVLSGVHPLHNGEHGIKGHATGAIKAAGNLAQNTMKQMFKKPFNDKYIGVSPDDLVWKNLGMDMKKRKAKKTLTNFVLTMMIIFWAIPVAVVGCISNINYLTSIVPFLNFINNCPKVILGLITGLLPTILLALLMSFVPVFIKMAGKFSGLLTLQEIDNYCQKWYYAFQVIEVFIVVTAASSASATVKAIIKKPSLAMTLLAQNLPKASNFYIVNFLLQGLSFPSGILLQLVPLILSKVLGKLLDKTPRQKWARWNTLAAPSWGVLYPVMELFVVIMLVYSIIAPIILVFSTICLTLMYIAYIYTLNYVMAFAFQSKGKNYVRALFNIFCALYLAEICLLGLFIMGKNWGCLVLEVVIMVVTVLSHLYLQQRFLPLLDIVPLSILRMNGVPVDPFDAIDPDVYAKYPHQDQGWKDYKDLEDGLEEEQENEVTEIEQGHQKIRPATDEELRRAHYLSEDADQGPEDVFDDSNELSATQTKTTNANGEPSNTHKNSLTSTLTSNSLQRKSTFVEEDIKKHRGSQDFNSNTAAANGESLSNINSESSEDARLRFHKLHYADIQNLEPPPINEVGGASSRIAQHNMRVNVSEYPDNFANTESLNRHGIKKVLYNFFHPSSSYNFVEVRERLPKVFDLINEDGMPNPADKDNSPYKYPRLDEKPPIIWIAKDPMGVSDNQVAYSGSFNVDVRNDYTGFNGQGKPYYTGDPPDFEKRDF
ncbi:hypothetical protein ACO0RG_001493 [Hanseniaspora osmophila]|uniref:Phosphate metabolism protein 7 n=1 Tax=Hanseniaspora osmophila TaxID=56408 RepID=A0A1E5R0D5_9ASCO|nr:Phosphate metabolism protein 7 [Hanseniaspora osmophila]